MLDVSRTSQLDSLTACMKCFNSDHASEFEIGGTLRTRLESRRELSNPEDVQDVQNLIHETSPKLKDVERLTKYEKFRRPQQNANCLASAFADGTNTCGWQGLLFVKRLRTLPELDFPICRGVERLFAK